MFCYPLKYNCEAISQQYRLPETELALHLAEAFGLYTGASEKADLPIFVNGQTARYQKEIGNFVGAIQMSPVKSRKGKVVTVVPEGVKVLNLTIEGIWGSNKSHAKIFDLALGYMDSPKSILSGHSSLGFKLKQAAVTASNRRKIDKLLLSKNGYNNKRRKEQCNIKPSKSGYIQQLNNKRYYRSTLVALVGGGIMPSICALKPTKQRVKA